MTRMTRRLKCLGSGVALAASVFVASPAVSGDSERPLLKQFLSGSGVVQRGVPLKIGGFAEPEEELEVWVNGVPRNVEANANGRWELVLEPGSAGETLDLDVRNRAGNHVSSSLVYGDVWLCSGQSNMDLAVDAASNARNVLRNADRYDVRLLKIPRSGRPVPVASWPETVQWSKASEDTLASFSAACWHMGAKLAETLDVPVGLVQASWGGSSLEDWSSRATLESAGGFERSLALLADYATSSQLAESKLERMTEEWSQRFDPGLGADWHDPGFDDSSWHVQDLPGLWEQSGIAELRSYDGTLWYRRSFSLDPDASDTPASLHLGRIDERDTVWLNGKKLGTTTSSASLRTYEIPAGVLASGQNVVAVRVVDHKGGGGFAGSPEDLRIELKGREPLPLAGEWRFRIGVPARAWPDVPPLAPWATPRGISMLYNGMIAPLEGIGIKGVAWYQGESNASESEAYARLMPLWIADWRQFFGNERLPVVIVQLPDYGPLRAEPSDENWPRLREVQRQVAIRDPYAGLAVTIDQGVPDDIHPTHKNVVGARMAGEALRLAYDSDDVPPAHPVDVSVAGDSITVRFTAQSAPLQTMSGASVLGFESCAEHDCQFAIAFAAGDRVRIIRPPQQATPITEIRYAWQPSPIVNLYDSQGVPVPPFRLTISE